MKFLEAYRVSDNLATATPAQVAKAEATVGGRFPPGYTEYVTQLGLGDFSTYVRVYMPDRVERDLAEWRERVQEYYFWDAGADVLTKERVLKAVVFADTFDGDELIFEPGGTGGIYVLPRHDEYVYYVGDTLDEAIEWLCGSGKLTGAIEFRYFQSWADRAAIRCSGEDTELTYDSVRSGVTRARHPRSRS